MTFKFEDVSPEEITNLRVKLQESGMQVNAWPNTSSDTFKFSGHHVNGTATYDPIAKVLSGELSKPFYISEETITNGLMNFLNTKPTVADETGVESKDDE